MPGKIVTLWPALSYEQLLATTHIALAIALVGVLMWAIRRPAED